MFVLAREATALGTGIVSGGAGTLAPIALPVVGTVPVDMVAEVATLIVGGGLQFFAPQTMPNAVDGIVDGSLALLGKRVTHYFVGPTKGNWNSSGYAARGERHDFFYHRVNGEHLAGAEYAAVSEGAYRGQTNVNSSLRLPSLT